MLSNTTPRFGQTNEIASPTIICNILRNNDELTLNNNQLSTMKVKYQIMLTNKLIHCYPTKHQVNILTKDTGSPDSSVIGTNNRLSGFQAIRN